jgi:hypothetical protein
MNVVSGADPGTIIATSTPQPVGGGAEPISDWGGPGYFWLPPGDLSGVPLANSTLGLPAVRRRHAGAARGTGLFASYNFTELIPYGDSKLDGDKAVGRHRSHRGNGVGVRYPLVSTGRGLETSFVRWNDFGLVGTGAPAVITIPGGKRQVGRCTSG